MGILVDGGSLYFAELKQKAAQKELDIASLKFQLAEAARELTNHGVIVCIETKPCLPLSMGNYDLSISYRAAHWKYRKPE